MEDTYSNHPGTVSLPQEERDQEWEGWESREQLKLFENSSQRPKTRQYIPRYKQQREDRRLWVGQSDEWGVIIRIHSCWHALLYEPRANQRLQVQRAK